MPLTYTHYRLPSSPLPSGQAQLELALRESRRNYEALVNSIDGIVWEADAQTFRFTFVSQQAERLLGYPTQRWISEPLFWADHLHPDDRAWAVTLCATATRERRAHEVEYRMVAADGRVVWLRDIVSVVMEPGQPVKLRGVMVDITEHRQREWEREAVLTLSTAMRVARTRAEMIPIVLDRLLAQFKADGAALALRQPMRGETLIELGAGAWTSLTGRSLPPGAGLSGRTIRTGLPYLENDGQANPFDLEPDVPAGTLAVVCMPLTVQGQTFGAVWLGRSQPFSQPEVNLFAALADMVANAVQRTTLHEQTELRLRRLAALHSIDTAITANLDLRAVLNLFLNEALIHLGVDAADVLLLNHSRQTLDYAVGRGFRQGVRQRSLRPDACQAGHAVRERRLIEINLSGVQPAPDGQCVSSFHEEPFAAYYALPLIAKGQVYGVLEVFHRAPLQPDPDWLDFLKTLAGQAAIALHNAALVNHQQRANAELTLAYDATIEGWSRALDLRDKETEGHTERVTELTLRLARALGFPEEDLVPIYRGALLHDIGKVGVPDSILLKPGPLTDQEWAIMRQHPVYAHEMLAPIAYLRPALDIPYCHHERWDGTGYPRQLQGEAIPLAARIFAVADVWDALSSDRPYRRGWPKTQVRDYIRAGAGTHFDPSVVDAFLQLMGDEGEELLTR